MVSSVLTLLAQHKQGINDKNRPWGLYCMQNRRHTATQKRKGRVGGGGYALVELKLNPPDLTKATWNQMIRWQSATLDVTFHFEQYPHDCASGHSATPLISSLFVFTVLLSFLWVCSPSSFQVVWCNTSSIHIFLYIFHNLCHSVPLLSYWITWMSKSQTWPIYTLLNSSPTYTNSLHVQYALYTFLCMDIGYGLQIFRFRFWTFKYTLSSIVWWRNTNRKDWFYVNNIVLTIRDEKKHRDICHTVRWCGYRGDISRYMNTRCLIPPRSSLPGGGSCSTATQQSFHLETWTEFIFITNAVVLFI